MDVSGIAGAGKSHLLKQAEGAVVSVGKSIAILSPTAGAGEVWVPALAAATIQLGLAEHSAPTRKRPRIAG
jgi:hypothetical protein